MKNLGYPAEDVQGFIENETKECKCVGCWNVYGDVEQAQKKFELYIWYQRLRYITKSYHNASHDGIYSERDCGEWKMRQGNMALYGLPTEEHDQGKEY